MTGFFLFLIGLLVAPLLGGLIAGLDRRITARFQSRFGPPILQPFYDTAKLFGKETLVSNVWQAFSAILYLCAAAVSVGLLFAGADLLLIFFVQAVGAVMLVVGAMSVDSPYSQVGAQRELIQILTYEPLLLLVFIGFYMTTGSFRVADIVSVDTPLLFKMPLLFLAMGYALTIKLRKSPLDLSTSHHGHQELVKGVMTDYSGPYLGIVEIAHWYESIFVLGLVALFWGSNWFMALVLIAATYFVEILVDNITSRLTWRWMMGRAWGVGLAFCFINLLFLYAG